MKEKNYKIKLTTLGPVHIGSGEIIKKKEYMYNKKENIFEILNQKKFLELLLQENLLEKYEKFIMSNHSKDLFKFIIENKLEKKYKQTINYKLDASELKNYDNKKINDLNLCVKDPYKKPYIPGSSLKGAIITNILYSTALNSRDKLADKYYHKIKNEENKKNISKLEKDIYKDLILNDFRLSEIGKLISIGDSTSVELNNLTIAQKYDYFPEELKRNGNEINLIRESIKTNTEFEFMLKLYNTEVLSLKEIEDSITNTFLDLDNLFREKTGYDELDGLNIYLGGGTGFISKTIVYGLLKENQRIEIAAKILKKLFPRIDRIEDKKIGLVPKTIKEGITPTDFEEMGICKLEFREV